MKVNIGKNTIGDNDKMAVYLKEYGRSTHDLSYAWRSSMGVGTLVPFMKILALPGDSFNINLDTRVMTHPTVGALFGKYKLQMDVFTCPIRLYNAMLHNNALNIGLEMSKVSLPQFKTTNKNETGDKYFPMWNRSSIMTYLGYNNKIDSNQRPYQIVPLLAYLDIFKNYYANKQEEKYYALGNDTEVVAIEGSNTGLMDIVSIPEPGKINISRLDIVIYSDYNINIEDEYQCIINMMGNENNVTLTIKFGDLVSPKIRRDNRGDSVITTIICENFSTLNVTGNTAGLSKGYANISMPKQQKSTESSGNPIPYDLKDIDELRTLILSKGDTPIVWDERNTSGIAIIDHILGYGSRHLCEGDLGGLLLKTHFSDLFNNWINNEWIDNLQNGITAVTAINTEDGSFTIDTLNLKTKVYNMLNRIAVSGGTYKDWIETVYTTDYYFRAETPVYEGGASADIDFQEVVSNSATDDEPLGTIAGRGTVSEKRGGNVNIKVNEPCYIIGIASITPYVDYSQGRDWDVLLKTMDDLHKPQLDGIGYQDLSTIRMDGRANNMAVGKQPAWIEYMTNYNKTFANFAAGGSESFMCLNRIYEIDNDGNLENYTTYINPKDYTYIFAENDITNQDFWVQIGCGIEARRVMSAKQIPLM